MWPIRGRAAGVWCLGSLPLTTRYTNLGVSPKQGLNTGLSQDFEVGVFIVAVGS